MKEILVKSISFVLITALSVAIYFLMLFITVLFIPLGH